MAHFHADVTSQKRYSEHICPFHLKIPNKYHIISFKNWNDKREKDQRMDEMDDRRERRVVVSKVGILSEEHGERIRGNWNMTWMNELADKSIKWKRWLIPKQLQWVKKLVQSSGTLTCPPSTDAPLLPSSREALEGTPNINTYYINSSTVTIHNLKPGSGLKQLTVFRLWVRNLWCGTRGQQNPSGLRRLESPLLEGEVECDPVNIH